MKKKTIGLILSIALVAFSLLYDFRHIFTKPEFYLNAALVVGVVGVIYFAFFSSDKERA